MSETTLLIGSLSNDLHRVASLIQRNSQTAAQKFLYEAKRWAKDLKTHQLEPYIENIVNDIEKTDSITMQSAEKYLMYSVLLANYTLHINDE